MCGEGSLKSFHVFINYRVNTDAAMAEKICDKLQLLDVERNVRLRCFLDKQNIRDGHDWRVEFIEGLKGSCLFLPIITARALEPITNLTSPSTEDNVLLEYETALKMREEGSIEILPLFVGEVNNGSYSKFNGFGMPFPDFPRSCGKSAKETMSELFQIQGIFVNPDDLVRYLPAVQSKLTDSVWPLFRDQWIDKDSLGPEEEFECVQCGNLYRESVNGAVACMYHPRGKNHHGAYVCCGKSDSKVQQQPAVHVHSHMPHQQFGAPRPGFPGAPGANRPGFPGQQPMAGGFPGRGGFPGHQGHQMPMHQAPHTQVTVQTIEAVGCAKARHHKRHHNLFAYAKKFDWIGKRMNYVDKRDVWGEARDVNVERQAGVVEASCGVLKNVEESGHFFIRFQYTHFLFVFSVEEMMMRQIPPRDHKDDDGTMSYRFEYADSTTRPTGVVISAQAISSSEPFSVRVTFDINDGKFEKTGEEIVSRPLLEYKPSREYTLPTEDGVAHYKGAMYPPYFDRKARNDFPTEGTVAKIKVNGPIKANPSCMRKSDIFRGAVTVINRGAADIAFIEATAQWRLEGEHEWKEATVTPYKANAADTGFPFTLPGGTGKMVDFGFDIVVTGDSFAWRARNWFGCSWAARYRPVELRLKLEDMDGNAVYQRFEYVNPRHCTEVPPAKADGDKLFTLAVPNTKTFDFEKLYVSDGKQYETGEVCTVYVQNSGRSYNVSALRKIAFDAKKENTTAVPLEMTADNAKGWALVDLACCRVYAMKFVLATETTIGAGYFRVPLYGQTFETTDPKEAVDEGLEPLFGMFTVADEPENECKPSPELLKLPSPVPAEFAAKEDVPPAQTTAPPTTAAATANVAVDPNVAARLDALEASVASLHKKMDTVILLLSTRS
eukprot:Rmarinus@m.27117